MPNPTDPRVQAALAKVRQEMPGITGPLDVSPSPGILPSSLLPGSDMTPVMTTDSSNRINYSPSMISNMNSTDLENTLAHELTHVGQNQQNEQLPWYQKVLNMFQPSPTEPQVPAPIRGTGTNLDNSFYWRPNEMEAYQTMKDRALKQRQPFQSDPMTQRMDIYLPPEKGVNTAPSKMR